MLPGKANQHLQTAVLRGLFINDSLALQVELQWAKEEEYRSSGCNEA